MKAERDQQVDRLIHEALELEPHQRAEFLARACKGDTALRLEVEELLSSYEATHLLTDPAPPEAPTHLLSDAATVGLSEGEQGEMLRVNSIGPYRIIRQLGQGGMGTVYLAARDDDQYKKTVAIKLVKSGMDNDFIIRRFRNERQILASLDHPYIGRLLDGGTTEYGIPYFVMEYIEGKPITEYCDDRNLSIMERLTLFRKICSAVHYAHQNLIVHRDIKPSNILVTDEGVPKLLDFGIAKLLDSELSGLPIDAGATAVGMMTPEYASPEQVRGEAITTVSDVYSLGIILYQLLTGRRPYRLKNYTPQEIVQVICEQEPVRPSTAVTRAEEGRSTSAKSQTTGAPATRGKTVAANPDKLRRRLSGDLDNIVLMALRKEPARRYSSADELSKDIQRHLDGLPVIARKDTFGYRAEKFIRRNRLGVSAAAMMLVLLVGSILAINTQRARAERRFNDVRQLANSFMFEVHDAIETLPGATPARELLVKKSLEYLDSLVLEAGGDETLQRELAHAYRKVGDVQGYPFEANLGDTAGALESYRKALAISEALVADNPADVEMRRDLLVGFERVGDVLMATGDTSGSLEYHRKSLAIAESLSRSDPADNQIRRNLLVSHLKVGEALSLTGETAPALENYRRGLEIARALVEADPQSPRARRDLSVLHNKVGDMLVAGGDAEGALDNFRTALSVRESLAAENPTNAQARRDVATSNEKIAGLLASSGDAAAALEYQRRALASDEALAAADPANVDAQFDLGISQGNVGEILFRAGDMAGALESQRRSQAILERVSASAPDNTEMQYELADTYVKMGNIFLKAGDAGSGGESYDKGRLILERLSAADPENAELRGALAETYSAMGEVRAAVAADAKLPASKRAERLLEARSWYQRSLDIYTDMRARNILQSRDAGKPDELAGKISSCDAALAALNQ